MAKFLIVRTRPDSTHTGGRVLVGIDNIATITTATKINLVYSTGLQVQISFDSGLVAGDENPMNFVTKMIQSLCESDNSTVELPVVFPNCFDTLGNPLTTSSVSWVWDCCTP